MTGEAVLQKQAGRTASGLAGCRDRLRAEGIFKAICRLPALAMSAALMMFIFRLLPAQLGALSAWLWIGVLAALTCRSAESIAVRALFGARIVSCHDVPRVGAVLANLNGQEIGVESMALHVNRRSQPDAVRAFGRRSLVIDRRYFAGVVSGAVSHDEAVATIGHGALVIRSGRTRLNLAIYVWMAPWRVLCSVKPPRRGVLGLAWELRSVIFGVAIWRAFFTEPAPGAPVTGCGLGVALAALLVTTYLAPWLGRR